MSQDGQLTHFPHQAHQTGVVVHTHQPSFTERQYRCIRGQTDNKNKYALLLIYVLYRIYVFNYCQTLFLIP